MDSEKGHSPELFESCESSVAKETCGIAEENSFTNGYDNTGGIQIISVKTY